MYPTRPAPGKILSMKELLTQVPAQLEETLKTLTELQRRLDRDMNTGLAASPGAGTNDKHVAMAVKLADATTKLGRETRAWSKKVVEAGKSASLEERWEAVVRFLLWLSPADRASLWEEVTRGGR